MRQVEGWNAFWLKSEEAGDWREEVEDGGVVGEDDDTWKWYREFRKEYEGE